MSSGRTGTRRELAAGRGAERGDDRGGRDDGRRLADALHAVGRAGLRILDQLGDDRRHVERRRDQVVGEARVRDQAVARPDLLHQREAEALGGATLDLALDRERVDRLADVLRRPDPDEPCEAELDVDLGDDAHRRDREGDVRALGGDLAGLGIERRRPRVAVDALDVDLSSAAPLPLLERRAAGELDRAGRHPGHPRGGRRAGRSDGGRAGLGKRHVVGAELRAGDLEDHVRDALSDLGRRAVDLGGAVRAQDHAGGRVVVEALGVADVLEAHREADAASHALAARRVARAAGEADRLARQLLRLGRLQSRGAADDLGDRQRALDRLACRELAAGAERVEQAQLDGVDSERLGELVHLRLGREARLDGAEAAHRPAGRVVRVDARRLDQRVVDRVRPDREAGGVGGDRSRARGVRAAVEQDPHPDGDELAGPRGPVLAPDARRVPVHVAEEGLLPVVDDLHRPLRMQREHGAVDLHREVLPPAERAPDAREVDSHHVRRQVEAGRDLVAVDVQPLRRDVDVDAALAVRNRQPGLRAEEGLVLDPDVVDAGHGHVTFGVGIAVADDDVSHDVRALVLAITVGHRRPVGMERLLLGRALHVDDRLEQLVLDLDGRRRPARLFRLLGRDERDGLAVVAHAVAREDGLVGELEPVRLRPRNIGVGEHGVHAWQADGLRDVERDDPRVRVRAADGLAPEHPGRLEVARVGELARHLGDAVVALGRLADPAEAELLGRARRAHCAASLTASKIFA